jgi:hypothetical protein
MLPAKDADGIDDNGQNTNWRRLPFGIAARSVAERSRRDKPGPGFAVGSTHKMLTRPECDGEHLRFNGIMLPREWTPWRNPNRKNGRDDRVESNTRTSDQLAMASRRKDSSVSDKLRERWDCFGGMHVERPLDTS